MERAKVLTISSERKKRKKKQGTMKQKKRKDQIRHVREVLIATRPKRSGTQKSNSFFGLKRRVDNPPWQL